jgi:hypothetical protein
MRKAFFVMSVLGVLLVGTGVMAAAGAKKTCGQMTAEFAGQPAALADLAVATAEHFEAHAALIAQTHHKDAAKETDGLKAISGHLRAAAGELNAAAEAMRAASAWPSVPHDLAKMRADEAIGAARDHKIKALEEAAAQVQKEIDFWKKVPVAAAKK